jgi:hypothetical protein
MNNTKKNKTKNKIKNPSKFGNPIAKNMNKFNKPKIEKNKKKELVYKYWTPWTNPQGGSYEWR